MNSEQLHSPSRPLAEILGSLVEKTVSSSEISFAELAATAGLNPATDFVAASLKGLDLRGEDLRGFNFANADLRDADLRGANLFGVSLSGANTQGALGIPRTLLRSPAFSSAVARDTTRQENKPRQGSRREQAKTRVVATKPKARDDVLAWPAAKRRGIERKIISALDDFSKQFKGAYEAAYRLSGKIPAESTDEIRNAMDHLSRAINANDVTEAERNIVNGKAHIIQGTIDCLVVAVESQLEMMGDFENVLANNRLLGPELASLLKYKTDLLWPSRPIFFSSGDEQVFDLYALERVASDLTQLITRCNTLYQRYREAFPTERLIAAHAHRIWERAGCPEGRNTEHWLIAEKKIMGDATS